MTPGNIFLKKVAYSEIDALQRISIDTFCESFAQQNTEEDMRQYLDDRFNIPRLTDELNNPGSEFYLALDNGRTIGYLKLNYGAAQTELKEAGGMEIERIYLLQEYQGKKIGQLLFEEALGKARQKKIRYIWLGVWEKNHKAISFYLKNGFCEFGRHDFKLGRDIQTDIMMKKIL